MGECGIRGGYTEVINLDPDVKAMLLKSISAMLCPTTLGQVSYQRNLSKCRTFLRPSHGANLIFEDSCKMAWKM